MFSIIIPLYNKGKLIKSAIDSVLSQSNIDFEIVIVDDGSKDDSTQYVNEYKDTRILYYYKENGGVSSARNYGIEKANGEWIIFLDADDEMFPGTLASFANMIEKYRDANFFVARQQNNYEGHGVLQKRLLDRNKYHVTRNPLFGHWLRCFFPCPGTVCISRELIQSRGFFSTRISFYEDIEFMIRMMRGNKVGFTTHYSLQYNQDQTGLSGSSHLIEKEMAYYIPEYIDHASFWHKALLYENLEIEILWWQQHSNEEYVKFYQDMQRKYFSRIFKLLHWIRQKMIRLGII